MALLELTTVQVDTKHRCPITEWVKGSMSFQMLKHHSQDLTRNVGMAPRCEHRGRTQAGTQPVCWQCSESFVDLTGAMESGKG